MAAEDTCFPALVSNTHCSIVNAFAESFANVKTPLASVFAPINTLSIKKLKRLSFPSFSAIENLKLKTRPKQLLSSLPLACV